MKTCGRRERTMKKPWKNKMKRPSSFNDVKNEWEEQALLSSFEQALAGPDFEVRANINKESDLDFVCRFASETCCLRGGARFVEALTIRLLERCDDENDCVRVRSMTIIAQVLKQSASATLLSTASAAILGLCKDRVPVVRKLAIESLHHVCVQARSMNSQIVSEGLRLMAEDPDQEVRASAIRMVCASRQMTPALEAAMVGLCRADNASERMLALEALYRFQDPANPECKATAECSRLMAEDSEDEVRILAMRMLLSSRHTFASVIAQWSEERSERVRQAVCDFLNSNINIQLDWLSTPQSLEVVLTSPHFRDVVRRWIRVKAAEPEERAGAEGSWNEDASHTGDESTSKQWRYLMRALPPEGMERVWTALMPMLDDALEVALPWRQSARLIEGGTHASGAPRAWGTSSEAETVEALEALHGLAYLAKVSVSPAKCDASGMASGSLLHCAAVKLHDIIFDLADPRKHTPSPVIGRLQSEVVSLCVAWHMAERVGGVCGTHQEQLAPQAIGFVLSRVQRALRKRGDSIEHAYVRQLSSLRASFPCLRFDDPFVRPMARMFFEVASHRAMLRFDAGRQVVAACFELDAALNASFLSALHGSLIGQMQATTADALKEVYHAAWLSGALLRAPPAVRAGAIRLFGGPSLSGLTTAELTALAKVHAATKAKGRRRLVDALRRQLVGDDKAAPVEGGRAPLGDISPSALTPTANRRLCLTCEERPRQVRCRPCGHGVLCGLCAVRCIGAHSSARLESVKCVLCRAETQLLEWLPEHPEHAPGEAVVEEAPLTAGMPTNGADEPAKGEVTFVRAFLINREQDDDFELSAAAAKVLQKAGPVEGEELDEVSDPWRRRAYPLGSRPRSQSDRALDALRSHMLERIERHIGRDRHDIMEDEYDMPVDIGEWAQATGQVGEELLLDPMAANALEAEASEVAAIYLAARRPRQEHIPNGQGLGGEVPAAAATAADAPPYMVRPGVVGTEGRAALISHLEAALRVRAADAQASQGPSHQDASGTVNPSRDMKLELSRGALEGLLGLEPVRCLAEAASDTLESLVRKAPSLTSAASRARLCFKLRRRAAVAGSETDVIPFHCDASLVVVNVALNDNFVGAKLLFATEHGRMEAPSRSAGDATAHDCTVVHGVTRLASGVRYNLYAIYEEVPLGSAAAA